MSSCKRKRVSLSITTIVEILKKMDEGSSVKVLSDMYNIALSTIYDIKKQKKEILSFYSNAENPDFLGKRKTFHQAKNDNVDKVLMEWIRQKRMEKFPLTRCIIMAQAKKFHDELGIQKNCDYSTGWFTRFKQRNGVRLLKISGEQASADTEAAELYVDTLSDMLQNENVTLDQLFNADETALYYKYVPRNTYTTGDEKSASGSGFKEAKQRITLLACANAAGTCKLKLAVIGNSKNPRAFKGVKVLPVNYQANKKAWMTQDIFIDWFNKQFIPQARAHCQSVGLSDDCKIILFLDNCTAHPPAALLKANNVEIQYLPPNCTSLIQPLDQGVLRSLKCKYKVQFLRKMLDASNEKKSVAEFQKEFNIKDAVWMASRSWDEVSQETLTKAWHNLIPTTIFRQNEKDEPTSECSKISKEKCMQQELLEYAKSCCNIDLSEGDVKECFEVDNDVPIVNEMLDAEIINMVLNREEKSDDDNDDNNENSFSEEKISNEKCIELTKQLIRGLEQKSFIEESHIMAVYKIQDLLLKQKSNFKQLKLDEMFNKK